MTQTNQRALKMLSVALDMEEKGRKFYEKAIAQSKNEMGREIFTKLRDDEIIHVERIRSIYESLEGGSGWSSEWKALQADHEDLGEIFRALAKKHGKEVQTGADDIKALKVGIDFEAAAVDFYTRQKTEAKDDLEREFCEKMIVEERGHHKVLSDMEQYFSDPAIFFMELEHSGLDG